MFLLPISFLDRFVRVLRKQKNEVREFVRENCTSRNVYNDGQFKLPLCHGIAVRAAKPRVKLKVLQCPPPEAHSPPFIITHIPHYTHGRSRSSQKTNCLSRAPLALSSLHSPPLPPKQQQALHLSLHLAPPLPGPSGASDPRLSPQSSRRVSRATKTRRRRTCLPRRSSRRRRSSWAAPATI